MYVNIHSSTIHSRQKAEIAQVSVVGGMDDRRAAQPDSGMVLSHRKGGSPDAGYNVVEPQKHRAERSQTQKATWGMIPRMGNKSTEKADGGLAGAGGAGWGATAGGGGVSFQDNGSVLESDLGGSCPAL